VKPPKPQPHYGHGKRLPGHQRQRRRKRPDFEVEHRVLGVGQLVSLHLGDSGIWLADVEFGSNQRTLRLEQAYWVTPVKAVIAVADQYPPLPVVKPRKADVETEVDGDTESELDGDAESELGEDTDEGTADGDGKVRTEEDEATDDEEHGDDAIGTEEEAA
jgi:hypothetical protein